MRRCICAADTDRHLRRQERKRHCFNHWNLTNFCQRTQRSVWVNRQVISVHLSVKKKSFGQYVPFQTASLSIQYYNITYKQDVQKNNIFFFFFDLTICSWLKWENWQGFASTSISSGVFFYFIFYFLNIVNVVGTTCQRKNDCNKFKTSALQT